MTPLRFAAGATPPCDVTVTTNCCVAFDCMATCTAGSVSLIPAAAVTCTLAVVWACSPAPAALIDKDAVVNVAVLLAVSVKVEVVLPTPLIENALGLQAAVTPEGSPVTVSATTPEKAPPVVTVIESVADWP